MSTCLDATKQTTYLCLAVSTVSPKRPNAGQLSCLRPPGDGLGVNPEQRRDLCWRQQIFCRFRRQLSFPSHVHHLTTLSSFLRVESRTLRTRLS